MSLTDTAIRSLRPQEKPYKRADSGGLHLLVWPSGSRLWRFAYRHSGRQKLLALGAYPAVSLLAARRKRDEARELLAAGTDPAELRREAKRAARQVVEIAFQVVALEWLDARKAAWTPKHVNLVRGRLEANVFPEIGRLPITSIEAPTLLAMLRKIERRGAHEVARRCRQACGQVFRFAIADGRATRDPSADLKDALKSPPPVKHRPSLKARDLPEFFGRLASYDGDQQTKLAIRFALLTMVRTAELRFGRWAEFEELEGPQPLWRIPPDRMKGRQEHLIPLSRQAAEVALQLREIAGNSPHFLPGSTHSGTVSENTLLFALYRMGYHSRATVHGFRTTASTILNESGLFHEDWIERQLAHVPANQVRAAYNAAKYLSQRRKMLQWWADYLDKQDELGQLIG